MWSGLFDVEVVCPGGAFQIGIPLQTCAKKGVAGEGAGGGELKTYIALFRGINVGGSNIVPMKELVSVLEGLGCVDVKTYIQSGNAVFGHRRQNGSRLSELIRDAVHENKGFKPEVLILSPDQFDRVVRANPFPEAAAEPSKLHVFFMTTPPENPDTELLAGLKAESERFEIVDAAAYLHAPDGIGRSKLAAKVERVVGVPATGRNWRTVGKILEIIGER